MTGTSYSNRMGWGGRLFVAAILILAGAAAATWGLAHYAPAARLFGIAERPAALMERPVDSRPTVQLGPSAARPQPSIAADEERVAALEERLKQVELTSQRAVGSAGRADNLVVAFAARRAIDRGVALGYLERLLVEQFGRGHPQAVATIVTGARRPTRLNDLIAGYDRLGPELRSGGGGGQDWWTGFKRELGSLVQVRNAQTPSLTPDARYDRASRFLQAGDVDQALAETMRMPGAQRAGPWVDQARRYVAIHRALDEIETAALMPGQS